MTMMKKRETPSILLSLLLNSLIHLKFLFVVEIPHQRCSSFGICQRNRKYPPYSFSRFQRSQLYSIEKISNPDTILSKHEITLLTAIVRERADARFEGDYRSADNLRQKAIEMVNNRPGISISIKDIPRNQGGGSTWQLVRDTNEVKTLPGDTVLQLAHKALGLAVASSEKGIEVDRIKLNYLLQKAYDRIQKVPEVEAELRGRKAADAALWFSLAGGITSSEKNSLLYALADISAKELKRFGLRNSCRAKDILQIMERFTAAGLRHHKELEESAFAALQSKEQSTLSNIAEVGILEFHSRRCLMMLWKFSTRQRKQRSFLELARNHWLREPSQLSEVEPSRNKTKANFDWEGIFTDPKKPLVVDIGCGMGVSLLGLSNQTGESNSSLVDDWRKCNFAGVDLSSLNITYANGLASCWGLKEKLHFFQESANSFVENKLKCYPGPIILCLIQFPTPYKLLVNEENNNGNQQLPSNAIDKNFMVSESLLKNIKKNLSNRYQGKLLIQSNCEDVAVWMHNLAIKNCDFKNEPTQPFESYFENDQENSSDFTEEKETKRTKDWIAMRGDNLERAQGPNWCPRPILPPKGRTETELACIMNGTPIHRCLLTVQ